MKNYLELVNKVLTEGILKENRTQKKALTIVGAFLEHNMNNGFPLLTTKKVSFKQIKVELEFFIKGLTNKSWLQERGCSIWNEWCSPDVLANDLSNEERKKQQLFEEELGPIYGYQWRNFGKSWSVEQEKTERKAGIDQLKQVVQTLKANPNDRRMIVSSWNPLQIASMALPPCHILFHLVVIGNTLNLTWFQRSCDLMLGIPFNIASYALLLHLLCLESKLKAGKVIGMLSDVHIYEDHIQSAKKQLTREPFKLCHLETKGFESIFSWDYTMTEIKNYKSHKKIDFPIAI